jgi:Asp-tRNA(Asn)/Glu-tRNA(Gln) amidotransferase A subunit family amidase
VTCPGLAEASDLLGRGQVRAIELVNGCLAAIEQQDNVLHAFATVDADGARAAAAASDRRADRGRRRSPLDGIPIGIKDLVDTRGVRTTYGSPLFADRVPDTDAHVVMRLRRAGAVVVGKTVTTEFATFDPPPTKNPWNIAHTPGGSSSGSAAGVAAGMIPGAIGTQTGGSTIRPASYCGVVGYMPSPGWVGRTGIFPCAWTLDRVGLFGAAVRDVDLLVDGCLGLDRGDPVSRVVRRASGSPGRARRAAVVGPLLDLADESMRGAVESVASLIAETGAAVERVAIDDLETAHAAHMTIFRAEVAAVHADRYAVNRDRFAPRVSELIETGSRVAATDYLRALRFRGRFRSELASLIGQYDVLLAPAATGPAEGSLDTVGSPVMNLLATFAALPAVSLPVALSRAGLPVGVQLIGRPDRDDALLTIAGALEERIAFQYRTRGGAPPRPTSTAIGRG